MARGGRRKQAAKAARARSISKPCAPPLAFDNIGDYGDLALEDEEIRPVIRSDLALEALARKLKPWFV